jgi:glycosyltransferase involved in cell wall biosynthesis
LPKVSVIIPVYNAEKFLSETIESVIAQTYPDWEIIAVDDGSTDRSLEILRKYEQRLPSKIHVITQRNSGVSIARNNAIAIAKGEYIAFLDHDDLWLPEKLEKQVELLDSNKELGLVYSDSYIIIDEEGDFEKNTYSQNIKPFRGNVLNELLYANFIPLLTAIIRKEVLNKVGMFNPKYKICEEYDLFLKIAEYYPVDFIEQPLAKYRVHDENFSRNIEILVNENFQIIEYWSNKSKNKNFSRGRIKRKKIDLYYSLLVYYFISHQNRKVVMESINLIKLFPYSLRLVPKMAVSLGHVLFHGR